MGKITRQQIRYHEQVEEMLWGSDRRLTADEVAFCLEHWDPRALAGKQVSQNQAYFTPLALAMEAGRYVGGNGRQVVDIGAGIGCLSYAVLCANWWDTRQVRITAVEINPEYVEVGRRLLPEVRWVQGDMYSRELWQSLPRFDEAVSNPPFGQVLTDCDTAWIGYRGPAGLMAASIGLQVARLGITMILPQTQTPFRYSGVLVRGNVYTDKHTGYMKRFLAGRPQLDWHHSSVDTEQPQYKSGWRGASPLVELVALRDGEAMLLPLSGAPVHRVEVPRPACKLATPD